MDEESLNEACGVFGCIASGKWPTQIDVANTICVGLVGLQHRLVFSLVFVFSELSIHMYVHRFR